jgi:transposase
VRIGGQRFRLYTNPQEVKILQARRATGPAWDTWLDYDWMLQRARETGRIGFLMERGLTEAEAEKMIRREVADARQLLGVHRGAQHGPRGGRPPDLSDEQRATILKHAAEERLSQQGIANAVGATRAQVRYVLGR